MALGNNGNGGLLSGLLGNGGQVQALMAENAMLKAENYSDKVGKEVYAQSLQDNTHLSERIFDKYIGPMAAEISEMRVREARNDERIKCMGDKMEQGFHTLRHEFGQAIALESERRLNGDRALECYVNATFVPGKLVMPRDAICPEVMQRYNSWTAPTEQAPDTVSATARVSKS